MKTPTSCRVAGVCVGAVTAALALTGCAADGGERADGTVTLHVWSRDGGVEFEDQVAAFESSHPGIRVEISTVAGDQYLAKLANSIRAGTAPDLISFDMVNAPLLAAQGVLADVTDRARSMPLDDLAPAGVEIGRLDDRIYSLPVALNSSQMFWNEDLFARAGLDPDDPPASLAEVKTYAEKIDGLGGDVTGFSTLGGVAQAFTGFPSGWADGGDLFTAEGPDQRATFTDPAMLDMVSWYQDMWTSGLMQPTDQPNQDPGNVGSQHALQGKVGIVFTGANVLTPAKDSYRSAAGIPGTDEGELSSFLGGDQIALTDGTKHPDQAWELLDHLLTDRDAARAATDQGWIAPDLALARELATDRWSKDTVDALAVGQLPKSIAYNAAINDPNGPWAQGSQDAIFSGADPRAAMAAAEREADRLVQDTYDQVEP